MSIAQNSSHHIHVKGLLLGLAAYTVWAGSDTFNKLAFDQGSTPLQAMAVCGLLSAVFLFLKMAAQKNVKKLWPQSPMPVFLRAACNVGMMFCFYTSYTYLPLANAYIMEFTSPFLVAIGAALFLGEKLSIKKSAIILSGFIGAVIAINPSIAIASASDITGYAAALGGALFFALSQLFLRHSSAKENSEAIMFLPNIALSLVGLIVGHSLFSLSLHAFFFLIAMTGLSLYGSYLITAAARRVEASLTASLQYSQIIPAAILGYVIWHTIPAPYVFVGGLVIIGAGLVLMHQPHQDKLETLVRSEP